MRIPMLFMRQRHTTIQGNPTVVVSYIAVLPKCNDFVAINTAWQDNPDFPEGQMYRPDIDLLAKEDTHIFDGPNDEENYRLAMVKMKELWAQVEIN